MSRRLSSANRKPPFPAESDTGIGRSAFRILSFIVEFFPFTGHNIPREVIRMSSMLSVSAAYDWKPVLTNVGKEFEYPGSLGTNLRGEYSHPALYRWRIQDAGRLAAVAIAETDNLARTAALFN